MVRNWCKELWWYDEGGVDDQNMDMKMEVVWWI